LRFLKMAASNSYAMVDKDWRLSTDRTEKLDQEDQDRLARLKSWLAKQMRRVKLPDLLIEVDTQLGFTRHCLTTTQREELRVRGILDRKCDIQSETDRQCGVRLVPHKDENQPYQGNY
jgi:hypothetical protein